jgi:hypothetical protein
LDGKHLRRSNAAEVLSTGSGIVDETMPGSSAFSSQSAHRDATHQLQRTKAHVALDAIAVGGLGDSQMNFLFWFATIVPGRVQAQPR